MRTVVLDPGVLLNAVAGDFLRLLKTSSVRFVVPEPLSADLNPWQDIATFADDAESLASSGIVEVAPLRDEEELGLFVEYAAVADESEAAAAALAHYRTWTLASDQTKLVRYFHARTSRSDGTISTLGLLRSWADSSAATSKAVAEVVRRLHSSVLLSPDSSDSGYTWWLSQCRTAGIR